MIDAKHINDARAAAAADRTSSFWCDDASPAALSEGRIARHAYEIYRRNGQHDGHAQRDWNQARRELRNQERQA